MFRVAASGRIGFGHLVRATRLAAALGVPARVSIRGTAAARETARRLGAAPVHGTARASIGPAIDLLVIDDPSRRAALPWLRAARRAGVAVASVHDLGIAPLPSDLAIDGSLGARRVRGLGRTAAGCRIGPAFAVLSAGPGARARRRGRVPTVVIGLGGGRHAAWGVRIARELRSALDRRPGSSRVRVLLSLGVDPSRRPGARGLAPGIAAVAPERFAEALAGATVAIVGGGITLYEACAMGTPVVAVPVVAAQAITVRRFVRAGLAVGAGQQGRSIGDRCRAAAAAALTLLGNPRRRDALAARGPRTIDGAGAVRVAAALRGLWRETDGRARTR